VVCLAVTYRVRAGAEERAAELLRRLTEPSRREPACLMYQVHRVPGDPTLFFLYEQYEDRAGLDAHRDSDHFRELAEGELFPLLESREPLECEPL
jgi:(4S)-4-hydroxy-5-phosphonooxypentane-2,3-dione isomerase